MRLVVSRFERWCSPAAGGRVLAGALLPLAVGLSLLVGLPQAAGSQTGQARYGVFGSVDEVVEFLRTARVVDTQPVGSGSTRTDRVWLEQQALRASAAFRTVDSRRRDVRVGEQFFRVFYDRHVSEPAAYELARLLGIDSVPPTILRTIDGRKGSLQLWVEGAMDERIRDQRALRPPSSQLWLEQLHIMRLFDNLVYNDDRNAGNMLIDHRWKLWLIDHSRAFQRREALRNPERVTRVERGIWRRLLDLREAELSSALGQYLEDGQIRAVMARRDLLIEHVERLVADRGEEAVYFERQRGAGPDRGEVR